MEVVLLIAAAVVAVVVYMNIKARGIVRRHSRTLAAQTGIPAEQIYQDMVQNQLTPGEWAARRGLDPVTFQPRRPSLAQAHAMAKAMWARMRLDPTTPMPGVRQMTRIGDLQGELAELLSRGVPGVNEATRQAQILVELHDLGARVDADWVNDAVLRAKRDGGRPDPSIPAAQAHFDQWQRTQVQRRNQGELSMDPSPGFGLPGSETG